MKKKNHEVLKQFQAFKQGDLPTVNEVIDGDFCIVELFKYVAKEKAGAGNKKTILLLDDNGDYKSSKEVLNSRFLPLAKIVSVGKGWSKDHGAGDIVTLPAADIIGQDEWNPDFMAIHQFKDSSAGLKVPEGMRQKISALESKWYRYRYFDPFNFESHTEETRMYVIPSSKVIGKWLG